MQFIDLKTQQARIKDDLDKRIQTVLAHGQYIMGPEIDELEAMLAQFTGAKHCISMSSGTDALLIALMALGIKAGDEVITTAFTFIATGEVIALLGAIPVFVDICPLTYNLDANLIEAAITDKTAAIIPVSLFGQCADMPAINAVANKHKLPVIEDAAQSFGATLYGKQSCAMSTIGCTSFFPSKPLGGYGDSGACFTDDDNLALIMQQIRVHGQDKRYHHPRLGINGRMDSLQAAILLSKMEIYPEEVLLRQQCGLQYSHAILSKLETMSAIANDAVVVPTISQGYTSVYAQYSIQVKQRDKVAAKLNEQGIPTAIHYPGPLHKQPALEGHCRVQGDVHTCRVAEHILSLPMHPYLTEADIDRVTDALVRSL